MLTGLKIDEDPDGLDQHDPGAKLDKGKLLPELMIAGFANALTAVAEVTTYGATKYSPNGWQHVDSPVKRYGEAKCRHQLAGFKEKNDPESGLSHAAHEAWNALAVLEFLLRNK